MANRKPLVLKFGGTSLRSCEAIAQVMEIVRGQAKSGPLVTVVSAMSGVTDRLLELGHKALERKRQQVYSELDALRSLHWENFAPLTNSAGTKDWIERFLELHFAEIRGITDGIYLLREFSEKTRDKLLSYGEILSSGLLARVLKDSGGSFRHSDARDWIVGEWTPQGVMVDSKETERLIRARLLPILERGLAPVVPGFICTTTDGLTATLGRNGSDYSASIVGAALQARELWIYTDVDGVMTADPNLVAEAAVLSQISYQEAAEMSYFGAKVLHPKTMIPAVLKRIPIRIKNTFNANSDGTLITERSTSKPPVKTVTSARDLTLLNIEGNGMVGIPGITSRLFEVMARENITVMMISQSSSEHSICMVIPSRDANRAVHALQRELRLEIERDLIEDIRSTRNVAIVSIIGSGMRGTPGTSGKFFEALGKCRINVLAIAQGSSELNISAAIAEKDYRHAVQAIHTAFGLTRDLNVLLFGCGLIGRTLLKQIHENRAQIAKSLQVNLRVLGVVNSKSWLFSPAGLTGDELELLGTGSPLAQLPGAEPSPGGSEIFDRMAGTYRSDVVLVDATSAELASIHIEGLKRGCHIVTANKKPLTSHLSEYMEIQRLRRRKGLSYQYEATFGAGLPLLSTLQDMINTGDRVQSVQGCLSGTLGLICTRLDEGKTLSKAVAEAMSLGYTEPDPRDDLSGVDVARKSLIIAREVGVFVEPADIQLKALIPKYFFKLPSVDEFLEKLPAADAKLQELARAARAEGKVLRFIVDISPRG
ncbi:MAG TPA: bifunctional aspartate kinase/homoserine dehydrogenase I, partial [Acidobacteriota bacterium]|nr:bifunctional aspartate kinase/homoserine dehydrogenase I [Acidobacteriota bacterium]